jgi:hypothetical protein
MMLHLPIAVVGSGVLIGAAVLFGRLEVLVLLALFLMALARSARRQW